MISTYICSIATTVANDDDDLVAPTVEGVDGRAGRQFSLGRESSREGDADAARYHSLAVPDESSGKPALLCEPEPACRAGFLRPFWTGCNFIQSNQMHIIFKRTPGYSIGSTCMLHA